jgi:hypothetical protein
MSFGTIVLDLSEVGPERSGNETSSAVIQSHPTVIEFVKIERMKPAGDGTNGT